MSPRKPGQKARGAWIGWTPAKMGRICFRWPPREGTLYRIPTGYGQDQEARLEEIRDLVGREILAGTFIPEKRFPKVFGPSIMLDDAVGSTLMLELASWIDEKRTRKVRKSRVREYESHRRNYIAAAPIGGVPVVALSLAHFRAFQLWLVSKAGAEKKGVHEKTAANVIRGTLQAFIRDRGTPEQLVAIRSLTWERYRPGRIQDPFEAAERDEILEWFAEARPVDEFVSVALRFQGLTPSETRALRVGDFNRATSSIRVEQSEDEGEIAATKAENRIRVVSLPLPLGIVIAELCGLRDPLELLLRGIKSERALIHQWKRCLKSRGFRWRSIYQTKHTYAVLSALAGTPSDEIARHLGVTEETLRKHYKASLNKGRAERSGSTINATGTSRNATQ